jgi:ABC-2 type transport system permease protein
VRDVSRPVPFLRAARGVFGLYLDNMVWSRRSLLMAVLLGLPVLLALVYRVALAARSTPGVSGFDLYGYVVALYYVRNVVPLAALFYATALVADEVESKTITYLLSRPLERTAILVGKFGAYLVTMLCLSLPAQVLTFFLLVTARSTVGLGAYVPNLFADMGVLALASLVYGALFTLLGVLLRRPMILGLLFLFIWELMANLPGYMPRLTVTAYLRSLLSYRPPQEGLGAIFGQVLPTALSLSVLGVETVVFLAGAAWIFSRREFVLDQ